MAEAEGFDPALLSQSQSDKETQLHELGYSKVPMQFVPERVVGNFGVPGDGAGVSQRDFLPIREFVGVGKIEKLVVFIF